MLPEKHKEELIDASIAFMQTVAEIYGAEKGQELWTTIADTIDPDLKGEVFMAMLTGNYQQDKVHVRNPFLGPIGDKIALIKCIRNYDKRNLGLKEAKDIADSLSNGGREVLEVRPELRPTFVVELRKLGMVV
jgi:ribosomal protein L7/L12